MVEISCEEQVAGEMSCGPAEPDGVVALGFVAAGPWDFIAHHEVGEKKLDGRIAKHLDRDDMVSAVFNAFMSTTVQCAQCHNHKFDPVSMEDYYRLHTIFAAVDRRDRVYDLDPDIVKKRRTLEARISEIGTQIKTIQKTIDDAGGEKLKTLRETVAKLEKSGVGRYKTVPEHGYHGKIEKKQNVAKWVQLEFSEPVDLKQLRLIGSYDDYNKIGAGFGFPIRYKVETSESSDFSANVRVVGDFTKKDVPNPGVAPVEIAAAGKAKFIRITAMKLAPRKNDYIFALAEVEAIDRAGKNVAGRTKIRSLDSIEAAPRWRRTNLVDGRFTTFADPESFAKLNAAKRDLEKLLGKLSTPERIKNRSALRKEREEREKELTALPKGKMVYSLATDFSAKGKVLPTKGVPRKIHLLHRGDLRSPGDEMFPGAPALWEGTVPEFSLSQNHSEGERRAALAKYLTDPKNPLTWRSAANRIWLWHMGRGIVDSPNDFGRMGMEPTHPELLDWLAFRFREKQSVKDLHRLIVNSSTYRQASRHDEEKAAIDGSNEFYWRMNRRKLRAEELRDSVLSVAGVLDLKMGGPAFRDFKFKDDHTPKFWYHLHDPNDSETHRRTIYRFIARSQTQPFLTALDCADPSQMVAKRDETTTALQALVLMNNPFMLAMSEKFALRIDRPEAAMRLALGRVATPEEAALLRSYSKKHGRTALARLIFNLNEFAYVD